MLITVYKIGSVLEQVLDIVFQYMEAKKSESEC
jgi:hypothetical protein